MAGTIIADYIRADANRISLNVGNTVVASINASGILSNTGTVLISPSGTFDANNVTYAGSTILNSGRVRTSLQPAGSVLQFANTSNSTQFSTSTQYTYFNLHSISVTAVGNNSRYFLQCYQQAYHASSGGRGNVGWSVTINGVTTRLTGTDGSSTGDSWTQTAYPGVAMNRPFLYTSSVPAGTVLTFTLLGAMFDSGSITFNYSGYNMVGFLYVTEIAV